jgi:hypothetical protein
VEDKFGCNLLRNEGPSICYSIEGWSFSLSTDILANTLVTVTFNEILIPNLNLFTSYNDLFELSITGFNGEEFSPLYTNVSNTTITIQLFYAKSAVGETINVTLNQTLVLTNIYGIYADPARLSQ